MLLEPEGWGCGGRGSRMQLDETEASSSGLTGGPVQQAPVTGATGE